MDLNSFIPITARIFLVAGEERFTLLTRQYRQQKGGLRFLFGSVSSVRRILFTMDMDLLDAPHIKYSENSCVLMFHRLCTINKPVLNMRISLKEQTLLVYLVRKE